MNPENPTYNPAEEYDDGPNAETTRKRKQYEENLAQQRKNIKMEDEKTVPKDNVLLAQHKFVRVPDSSEPDHMKRTKQAIMEYRKRQFFKDLRENNKYDEYINMDQASKDKMFDEWKTTLRR